MSQRVVRKTPMGPQTQMKMHFPETIRQVRQAGSNYSRLSRDKIKRNGNWHKNWVVSWKNDRTQVATSSPILDLCFSFHSCSVSKLGFKSRFQFYRMSAEWMRLCSPVQDGINLIRRAPRLPIRPSFKFSNLCHTKGIKNDTVLTARIEKWLTPWRMTALSRRLTNDV